MANKNGQKSAGAAAEPGFSSGSRLSALKAKRGRNGVGWDDSDFELLARVVDRVTRSGALVSFSRTSDGGALCLYIKDGDEEDRQYAAHESELAEMLQELYAVYE